MPALFCCFNMINTSAVVTKRSLHGFGGSLKPFFFVNPAGKCPSSAALGWHSDRRHQTADTCPDLSAKEGGLVHLNQ